MDPIYHMTLKLFLNLMRGKSLEFCIQDCYGHNYI